MVRYGTGKEGNAVRTALIYLERVQEMLRVLGDTQGPMIQQAGTLVAEALLAGHHIYLSPTSHAIHTEVTHRAGGFMDPRVLSAEASELLAGDVVIIGTNAGVDPITVELALRCRERGVPTVAVTTVAYEVAAPSTHPSGRKLHEVADVTVDQGGAVGVAIMEYSNVDVPLLPASGVLAVAAVWMIFAEAAERMAAVGRPPLVYQSMQLPGALARNARYQAQAEATGVGYDAPSPP